LRENLNAKDGKICVFKDG
jgi:hypothetical protein